MSIDYNIILREGHYGEQDYSRGTTAGTVYKRR
jgi:hypothetical protein